MSPVELLRRVLAALDEAGLPEPTAVEVLLNTVSIDTEDCQYDMHNGRFRYGEDGDWFFCEDEEAIALFVEAARRAAGKESGE